MSFYNNLLGEGMPPIAPAFYYDAYNVEREMSSGNVRVLHDISGNGYTRSNLIPGSSQPAYAFNHFGSLPALLFGEASGSTGARVLDGTAWPLTDQFTLFFLRNRVIPAVTRNEEYLTGGATTTEGALFNKTNATARSFGHLSDIGGPTRLCGATDASNNNGLAIFEHRPGMVTRDGIDQPLHTASTTVNLRGMTRLGQHPALTALYASCAVVAIIGYSRTLDAVERQQVRDYIYYRYPRP